MSGATCDSQKPQKVFRQEAEPEAGEGEDICLQMINYNKRHEQSSLSANNTLYRMHPLQDETWSFRKILLTPALG